MTSLQNFALAGGCADSGGAGLHDCCAAQADAPAYPVMPTAAPDLAAGQRAAWPSEHLRAERQQLPQAYQRRMALLHPARGRSNAAQADIPSSSPGWAAPQQGPAALWRAVAAVEARAAAAASGKPAAACARADNSMRQGTPAAKPGAGPVAAVPAEWAVAAAGAGAMPHPPAVADACADVSVRLGTAAAKAKAAAIPPVPEQPVLEQRAAAGRDASVCVRLRGHEPGGMGALGFRVPEVGPAALQRAIAAVEARAAAGAANLSAPTAGASAACAAAGRAGLVGACNTKAGRLRGVGVTSASPDRTWFCWMRLLG